ncbi:hypothetical protein HDV57DRAFT_501882 [Trichoderma longibrachiatum]|uniref:Uncharacterized protein n=1 Tax=Trichoderma longibrachiatum ATCC 18648 TaxID=983965 RepID=A0A2T4CB54_TRILO|nr:hypothetical protein M440DRAFT_1399921 [Trichoderma longibrachiatum ATCC 18648]
MEVESPRLPSETTYFLGCPNHPPWKKTAFDTYYYASRHYIEIDEALTWPELESKTRSVRYHLSEYLKYQNCPEIEAFTPDLDDRPSAMFEPQTPRIFRYGSYNSPLSENAWRLKIASDMALSGLKAINRSLESLHCWRNGRESADIADEFGLGFLLMCASYAIRALHYSPFIDTAAHATLLLSGCLVLRSTCQLLYIRLRSVVISRCENIVRSIISRIYLGDIHQRDVDSLQGFWFRGLSLFRNDERLTIPAEREVGVLSGDLIKESLPAPGYVIPEDD